MKTRNLFRIIFWIILATCLIFLSKSSPVVANLAGSSVTFAPAPATSTGASCYIPNRYQKLCFSLDTITSDGEDASAAYLKFPDDWEVNQLGAQVISQTCDNGGSMSGFWQSDGSYGREVVDNRVQNIPDHCTGVYCWNVQTGSTNTNTVSIPWIWFGGGTSTTPHKPCSNDNYYLNFPVLGCDEHDSTPPASVPICEHVPLTILPETLPTGEAASSYTQQLTAVDTNGTEFPNSQLWWTISNSNWPSEHCHVYTETGKLECYANVNGVPLPAGTYHFTVNVQSTIGWADGSRDYTLVINPLLLFEPETLPYAQVNHVFTQSITVSGGTEPYTLTHTSGALPAGLSFDSATASFTGTPTVAGTFDGIILQAVDDKGVTKTHTYSLTVLSEHLFIWTPLTPTSGQTTTFTADAGFDYYSWSYASEPGGECNATYWGYDDPRIANINFYGKGDHKVCLTIDDYNPEYQTILDNQLVTVINAPPYIYGIYTNLYPSFPGQAVEARADFNDPDNEATFTCEIDWGDGTNDTGTSGPYGPCIFPPHSYSSTGSFTIQVTITDGEGASDTYSKTHEVVYLWAEESIYLLASNTHPTTVRLRGFAPEGTTSLQFNLATSPLHGTLGDAIFQGCQNEVYYPGTAICEADIVYTPTSASPLYVGDDQFTFVVQDGAGHTSDPGTVDFWVDDNQAPVAYDGTATVLSSEPSDFNVFAFDEDFYDYTYDDRTYFIDNPPQFGTLALKSYARSSDRLDSEWNVIGEDWRQLLIYTPKPGTTSTTDSFTFHVNDTHQNSNTATVALTLYTPKTLHVNAIDDVVDKEGCTPAHCSLREAVNDALVGDSIDFTLTLPNTITLTEGEILINKYLKILGPGANQLAISAGFLDPALPENPASGFRVFHIYNDENPVKASISGLTIRDGRSFEGGGIMVGEDAELILSDCQIGPNNIVAYAGGGISTDEAVLTMTNCTVIENHGTGSQGGAGIFVDFSDVTITNSTITGNITNNFGGGILAEGWSNVTLIHSTISGNTANQDFTTAGEGGGGGIYVRDNSKLSFWNTIVADNTDLTEPTSPGGHTKWSDIYGTITSLGGNLIGDGTGSSGWVSNDLVGTATTPIDPLFGALDIYDPGTTPLYPLVSGSPAIDAVECATNVTTDQRGVTRPQGTGCDIGAFEVENPWKFIFLPLITR